MFLRSNNRKKEGKDHRYFSIVENHRIASDKTVQRTPSPDTKLLIEKLKWQLPNQPPPRLVGQRESYEIEIQTVP
jgi:hypothetical protein